MVSSVAVAVFTIGDGYPVKVFFSDIAFIRTDIYYREEWECGIDCQIILI